MTNSGIEECPPMRKPDSIFARLGSGSVQSSVFGMFDCTRQDHIPRRMMRRKCASLPAEIRTKKLLDC